MPRTTDIKNNFNTGEISPFLLGRTDLAKYNGACEQLINFYVRIQGGVSRRPGLRFISQFDGPGRIIPFVSDITNPFLLLFFDGQLTIWSINLNTSIITFDTPYFLVDNLELIKYVRIGDIMYIIHPLYPVKKLVKLSDLDWKFIEPIFYCAPASQQDQDISGGVNGIVAEPLTPVPAATATITAKITERTEHSGPFTPNLIGHVVSAGTGTGTITELIGNRLKINNVVSYLQALVTVTSAFDMSMYNSSNWNIDGIAQNNWSITVAGGNPVMSVGDFSFVSDNPVFVKGDVGRQIVAGSGIAIIEEVTGTTATDPVTGATLYEIANVTIISEFDLQIYNSGVWFIRGSPNAYFSAGHIVPTNHWFGSNQFGRGSIISIRTTTKHPTDFSFTIAYTDGFTDVFRSTDLGRYVSFSGGYGQIVKIVSSTEIEIRILSPPTDTETDAKGNLLIAPAFPGAWFYDDFAFTHENGFPNAICFFQDRLWFAGTLNDPQTIWGSQIDDFENFAKGSLDDAGIEATLATGDIDTILWIQPYLGNVVIGTYRGEHILSSSGSVNVGQNTAAITPTNSSITFQSAYGVTNIQPIIIQEVLFYVQRSQFNVYQMEFNIQNATYSSKDLNILNNLIVNAPLIEMVYQQNPFKIAWFISADNALVGLTYDREQDVFAWHRHESTRGDFRSIASVPRSIDGAVVDEVYCIMKRSVKPHEDPIFTLEVMDYNLNLDYSVRIVSDTPASFVEGPEVAYLDGVLVSIVIDNAVLPFQLVSGNVIQFPPGVMGKDIQIGITYESSLLTVRPEVRPGIGTIQGILKRWNRVWIRLYNSLGLAINDQFIPSRTPQNLVGQGVTLFTGDVDVVNLGYDRDGRISITQKSPLPANILAMFGQLIIGEN